MSTVSLAIAITPGDPRRLEWWKTRAALMLEGFCAVQGRARVSAVRYQVTHGLPAQIVVSCETSVIK